MRKVITMSLVFAFLAGAAFADSKLVGVWSGNATIHDESVGIEFRIREANGEVAGTVSIPERATHRIPITSIDTDGTNVTLDVRRVEYKFQFTGKLSGDKIAGIWEWPRSERKAEFVVSKVNDDLPYMEEDVHFANEEDGVELAGTLLTPTTPGPHPGIVLIHGSGYNERWWVWYMADLFARNGIAALAFDKRGCGESGGKWETASLETLAMDGVAGVHFLQSRDGILADRVGMWGISQAGWIMPIAASKSDDIAFVVVTSGAAVTVEEEGYFDFIVQLRDAGFSESDQAKARDLLEKDFQISVTGEGYDELMEEVRNVRDEAWYKELRLFVMPADSPARDFYRINGLYDPVPYWKQIDVPVLFLYGEEDKSVEPSTSIAILEELMAESTRDFTIKTFPNANHGIRIPGGSNFPFSRPAIGYFESVIQWLSDGPLK